MKSRRSESISNVIKKSNLGTWRYVSESKDILLIKDSVLCHNRPVAYSPQCTSSVPTMHHFVTEMCTHAHISGTNGTSWETCLMHCGICDYYGCIYENMPQWAIVTEGFNSNSEMRWFHGWKRTKWKHFLPANCLITIYGFMTVNPHCTYAALWRLKLSATRTVRLTACPLVTGGFPWQMSSNADSFPGHDIIMVIIRKYSWWLSIMSTWPTQSQHV